jgi:putative two-component system response regulator
VRVLVVDDDEWIRELLVSTLLDAGYHVSMASSAEDALAKLHCASFDLVLSDVKMPGMDGITLSRFLSTTYPHLPVVLVTGDGDSDLARAALQQGASDFIIKPFNIHAIPIVVANNLERGRLAIQRDHDLDNKIALMSIQALAAAIDARQSYTAEHSRRVAALAVTLGEQVGLSPCEVRALDMAAQVHDVGKIGVPDDVLNKEGKLTDEEWATMRMHPIQGAKIVGKVPELSHVAEVVRYHHERMDGRGYPEGLRGESIPLLSRIIAVVDAYECMTSDRIYRSRLPVEEALRRLRESAGTQFDVCVVKDFLRLHGEGLLG